MQGLRKTIVIVKLDFEKAFDSIEHEVIYRMLRQMMGFSDLFVNWVKCFLESGTSTVLVNGVPGRNFKCRREVGQGDPISPLLFVLGDDLKMRGLVKSAT
jgi:hypothetical protein